MKELAHSPEWLALLHYFERSSSEIVNADFFLAKNGDHDPEAELEATISEFTHPTHPVGVLKQTPICAFPARLDWLTRQGFHFPAPDCPDESEFVESLHPKSLTLVFSSAYPNNPASMFGHTMVRINQGKDDPLLDYGVNYAAQVPKGESGLKYIPVGLLGLYRGAFEVAPYYQKVLEYNEAESRDLWEYGLAFTEQETRFWVKHLWELRFLAQTRYTFLKGNCSYEVIRSFQVLRPRHENWFSSNRLYTLPGDTVRALKENFPKLITDIRFRPSHFRILQHRYEYLSPKQRDVFNQTIHEVSNHEGKIEALTDPYVLEALNSYYDYLKIQQQERADDTLKQTLRRVRVTRAKLGGTTSFSPLETPSGRTNRPDLAHATRRVALTSSFAGNLPREVGVRLRLGLHDLLNPDNGYEANFGVTGADLEISKVESSGVRLKRFELFDLTSQQPIGATQFPVSWRVFSGWRPLLEPGPLYETTDFETGGGVGLTLAPISDHLWLGEFILGSTRLDQDIPGIKAFSFTAETFALFRFTERFKVRTAFAVETNFRFSTPAAPRATLESAWGLGKSSELRVGFTHSPRTYVREAKVNLFTFEWGYFF